MICLQEQWVPLTSPREWRVHFSYRTKIAGRQVLTCRKIGSDLALIIDFLHLHRDAQQVPQFSARLSPEPLSRMERSHPTDVRGALKQYVPPQSPMEAPMQGPFGLLVRTQSFRRTMTLPRSNGGRWSYSGVEVCPWVMPSSAGDRGQTWEACTVTYASAFPLANML